MMADQFVRGRIVGGLFRLGCLCLLTVLPSTKPVFGADQFTWNTNSQRVTVDLKSEPLGDLLEKVASATGWQVFVEPQTLHQVSAKFRDLAPGDALHLLLGDVNF